MVSVRSSRVYVCERPGEGSFLMAAVREVPWVDWYLENFARVLSSVPLLAVSRPLSSSFGVPMQFSGVANG